MKKVAVFAGGCLMAAASTAFADGESAPNQKCACWYVGAGVGYSKFNIVNSITPIPGVTYTLSSDDHDTGWKIFVGYQFNPNFAVEGGYVDLGEGSQTANFTAPITGTVTANFKSHGGFLDAIGILPIGDNFSLHAKAGGYYAQNSLDFSSAGAIAPIFPTAAAVAGVPLSEDKDEVKWNAGLGARYDFTKNFGVRAEWERYFSLDTDHSGGGSDVDLYSVNLIYSF